MKRFLFAFTTLLFICISSQAKNGYNINITASQIANKSIYLAGYYNGKIYAFDTLALDTKGKGIFTKEKKLDEGLYIIYLNSSRYYEFLIGQEQSLNVKIDTINIKNGFEVTGAPETDAFASFAKFMMQKRGEQDELKKKLESVKGDSIKEKPLKDQIKNLDDQVIKYQTDLAEIHKSDVMGLFVKALITPQFPKSLTDGDMTNEAFLMARYQYAKKHYWDNIDLTDKRYWRLNILTQKLEEFTQRLLIQIPDSIIPEVVSLIEKSKGNPETYNLMTNYMINYSVTSKIMGMDKLMVELANRYYFTGKAPWADSTIMANITSEVKKVRHNLIGMQAANLPLTKFDGSHFNLYDIKSQFTLVYFFEPSCGHCKEVTPKLYDNVYQKFKTKGFEVVCVYIMTDKKEWKEFLDEHKLYDWINAWDPTRESYYWQFYDTSTTPGVYLLDKDKKIIAKKIDVTSLDKILDFELNKKDK